jgi:hypothetical protein
MSLVRTQTLAAPTIPSLPASDGRFGLRAWRRFARHYAQMVIAMLLGMVLLGLAAGALGEPPGYDTLAGMELYMAAAMSLPMIAWMRLMGHSWRDCWEMTAWMVIPMFACAAPVALGLSIPGLDEHSSMTLSHLAMLAGMAAHMLHRWDVYALDPHCSPAHNPLPLPAALPSPHTATPNA